MYFYPTAPEGKLFKLMKTSNDSFFHKNWGWFRDWKHLRYKKNQKGTSISMLENEHMFF